MIFAISETIKRSHNLSAALPKCHIHDFCYIRSQQQGHGTKGTGSQEVHQTDGTGSQEVHQTGGTGSQEVYQTGDTGS